MKHYVVTISRQFAAMGRSVAQEMSKILGIEFYDRDIVEATAARMGLPVSEISYTEDNHSSSYFRSLYPLGTGVLSVQDELFHTQENIIRDLADKGSCMMILATDLPLSSRQLRRVVRRCAAGLAHCGSYWGHGSGDIAIGFTTAHCWNREETADFVTQNIFNEDRLDPAFAAAAEATEEAVLNALAAARTTTGPDGTVCPALCEFKKELGL